MSFIEQHKAGSPTQAVVYLVCLRPGVLARMFYKESGEVVSHGLVKRLLKELGYGFRKQSKQLATGSYAHRDLQFQIISSLILYMSLRCPVLSVDCKKKERLGTLYRDGKCYCTEAIKVYDHDYEHLSQGKIVPHGIYDYQINKGYMSIGKSGETAAFLIDNLLLWWFEYGIHQYPHAGNILLLCDAGGANSYRHHIFKKELLRFAKETGLKVVVSHYPPYSSKWNPIEHRLFSHVHKSMQGCVLSDYELVKNLIEQTSTATGLTVVARLNLKEYQTGVKADKNSIDEHKILYHPKIPELNYRVSP